MGDTLEPVVATPGFPPAGTEAAGPDAARPSPSQPTPAPGSARWRRGAVLATILLVLVMLGQMLVALTTEAREQSPVTDEPVYVGTAVVYLKRHSLQFNPEHPPLGKLLSAAALALTDVHLDPDFHGTQWQIGHQVLYGEGNDAEHILFVARLPMIILTLLFGLVVFAFARDLFGTPAGLLALALYAFSPDVIAHGALATNDLPMAGFLLATLWLLWRARGGRWGYLLLAGLAYGAALSTKMTALPMLPVVLGLAAMAVVTPRATRLTAGDAPGPYGDGLSARWRRHWRAALVAVAGVGLLATATVWAAYLVVDPALRYRQPSSARPHGLTGHLVQLLPLPWPYRGGMLVQFAFENREFGEYLFGQNRVGSSWYYLPAALLVKTPLGMLGLWLAAAVVLLAVRRFRPVAPYLLLPPALLLAIAMTGSRSVGVRYVLWLPILLAVAAGAMLAVRARWVGPVAVALAALVAVSSLRTYPYYLPYANEAFGGPSQTWRYLNDSNVDWGQELPRLARYLREHPGEQVWLVYKGTGDPAYYGINAADPTTVPPEQVHGLLAVSQMRVRGMSRIIAGREPVAVIGHAIWVYRIP